ncbi:MAG: MBL fold metallo-hydrolase, partial [Chloroflexi bacterium]
MLMGDVELHLLIADRWKADGGLMFGVVPKVLWEKQKPADGNNMIDCACVCLIARLNGRVIVCETGIGNKLSEKRAQQVMLREPESLLHHLQRLGIRPEEVDLVVTTHLHWDHAGGLTRRNAEGEVELTFKRARHFIQRSEWDFALQPDVRSRPSYMADDFTPLADGNDMVEFLDGDAEVLPGVHLRHVGGHTPGSQVLVLQSGEFACAVTGDLVCQTPNLRVPWNMAADIEPLRVLQQ